MKILFCLPGFNKNSIKLQPWLTVYNVAKYLSRNKYEIYILTDCNNVEIVPEIQTYTVKSLRQTNMKEIVNVIKEITPDYLVINVTPFSLATCIWYRKFKNIKKISLFSYSLYKKIEIIRSLKFLPKYEKISYGKQILVPRKIVFGVLDKYFDAAICQSSKTYAVLKENLNTTNVYKVLPGIDKNIWAYKKKEKREKITFLYTGSLSRIRGAWNLIDSFSMIRRKNIHLKILARGENYQTIINFENYLKKMNVDSIVQLDKKWLAIDELKNEFYNSDVVILPFILVPSELPVTIMEAISCGTPVIVPDIDGLADAAGEAGVCVPHLNNRKLAHEMINFLDFPQLKYSLNEACLKERKKMETWSSVGERWLNILQEI